MLPSLYVYFNDCAALSEIKLIVW